MWNKFIKIKDFAFVTKLAGYEHSKYIQHYQTNKKVCDDDYPLVQGQNIKNGVFVEKYNWYLKKDYAINLNRSKLTKNSILIPYVGSNLGEVGIFYHSYDCLMASNIAKVELINKCIDIEYLKYYLQSRIGQKYLFKDKQGSTQPNITMESIRETKVIFREIKEQEKIGKILSTIDKKIELNKKINEKLEEMAKTVYDYWFTQFDFPDENGNPYKSSGGKMIYNEQIKREIPEGWSCIKLKEVIYENKTALKNNEKSRYGIDLSVMPSNSIGLYQRSLSDNFSTNQFVLKKRDILFGSIRPYLKKAGIASFDGTINGSVLNFNVFNQLDYSFIVCLLTSNRFFNYAVFQSTGTKMPTVKSENILNFKLPYNNNVAYLFEKKIGAYWEVIMQNIVQNFKLIEIRDFLLPMLMNGQAIISDECNNTLEVNNMQNNFIKDNNYYNQRFELWLSNQGLAARGEVDMITLREIFDSMDDEDK